MRARSRARAGASGRPPRPSATLAVAAAVAAAFLTAGCIDELLVEPVAEPTLELTLEGIDELSMVGMLDTVRLVVRLDDTERTGLRVRWSVGDSTALAVRSLADATTLGPDASLADSLDALHVAELTYLRRGTHQLIIQLDSVLDEEIHVGTVDVSTVERWQSVSAGEEHTCAVTRVSPTGTTEPGRIRAGGEVFCWGEGGFGALGTGSAAQSFAPLRVATDLVFEQVRVGASYSCGVDRIGQMHCWGDNFMGQLGLGHFLDQFVPRLVALGASFKTFDVGKSERFTCGVLSQSLGRGEENQAGETYCWGSNEWGLLGCGTNIGCDTLMTAPNTRQGAFVVDSVFAPPVFSQLSLGGEHACGLEGVTAYCWGKDASGELGRPRTPEGFTKFAVPVEGYEFVEIAVGGFLMPFQTSGYSCGVRGDSEAVLCWGWQVGGASGDRDPVPRVVDGLPGGPLRGLTGGAFHACVLDPEGAAYCWGRNDEGQLGDGTTTSRTAAAPVQTDLRFGMLSAGDGHTCGVTMEVLQTGGEQGLQPGGQLYCWGDNADGQLGGTEPTSSLVPRRVTEPEG